MLYDDSEQVEVRYVIALAHYEISIYGGSDEPIPDGELIIRRNAICLTKRPSDGSAADDGASSKPFYLFSDNCSDKEDFYLALLHEQACDTFSGTKPPPAQRYEVSDMISLVQTLHSSEENLHTRWFNACLGRLFLALYKTPDVEDLVRSKITKKISRVKKPAFLSDMVIQGIDMGNGPPYITNPRLKDLTVDGGCSVEMDVEYSGNFKLQVATKARLDLGSRFKAREVDLVLSVMMKKLEGHAILRFKPPPSNRVWFTFERMPKLEMSVEPIVSSRQITYTIILRAIESRIREVIAETVVSPNWDDIPFTDTSCQRFRGGIWDTVKRDVDAERDEASNPTEEEESVIDEQRPSVQNDPTTNTPQTPKPPQSLPAEKEISPSQSQSDDARTVRSLSAGSKTDYERPKSWRSGTYASVSTPIVGTEAITVDAVKGEKAGEHPNAASSMIAISSRCQSASPTSSRVSSPSESLKQLGGRDSYSSVSSKAGHPNAKAVLLEPAGHGEPSSTPSGHAPSGIRPPKTMTGFGYDAKLNAPTSAASSDTQGSSTSRRSLASLSFAPASVARRWGWKASGRDTQEDPAGPKAGEASKESLPGHPIGRGHPFPPPGTPLPLPDNGKSKAAAGRPKRKPVPSTAPLQTQNGNAGSTSHTAANGGAKNPSRRDKEDLLVVAAPPESQPSSPTSVKSSDGTQAAGSTEEARQLATEPCLSGVENSGSGALLASRLAYSRMPRPSMSSLREGKEAPPSWPSAQPTDVAPVADGQGT